MCTGASASTARSFAVEGRWFNGSYSRVFVNVQLEETKMIQSARAQGVSRCSARRGKQWVLSNDGRTNVQAQLTEIIDELMGQCVLSDGEIERD